MLLDELVQVLLLTAYDLPVILELLASLLGSSFLFGFRRPVLWWRRRSPVVNPHGRFSGAQELLHVDDLVLAGRELRISFVGEGEVKRILIIRLD